MVNSYQLYIFKDKDDDARFFIGIKDGTQRFFKELVYGADTENPFDNILGHLNNLIQP